MGSTHSGRNLASFSDPRDRKSGVFFSVTGSSKKVGGACFWGLIQTFQPTPYCMQVLDCRENANHCDSMRLLLQDDFGK